jgi:hypothetical protein
VDERVSEVAVGAVGLVGELAELRVALALATLIGSAGALPARVAFVSFAAFLQLVVGALDRALDELAVERTIRDDRPAAPELDQHPGGPRLIDFVCTGALLLGAAGILRGLRANTHWLARDQLTRFGAIPTDQRVV